jgi:Phage tail assembly chaperone protein, TAC
MAYLTIKGKEYEARTDFKFQRTADKKYTNKEASGFMVIYAGLLDGDVGQLASFWDCAISHHKQRPSLDDIEEALYEAGGEEQDYEQLFKDAFSQLDNAGFFRKQVNNYWKNAEMMKDFVENEKEAKGVEIMVENQKASREHLNQ